jgi:hypothetical protein
LANTKKNNMTSAVFLSKMQGIADELAAAGKPVPDDRTGLLFTGQTWQ